MLLIRIRTALNSSYHDVWWEIRPRSLQPDAGAGIFGDLEVVCFFFGRHKTALKYVTKEESMYDNCCWELKEELGQRFW